MYNESLNKQLVLQISVIKTFDFETAHALDGYEGKCKDIHGHSYHLKIEVIGKVNQDKSQSDCGMVIDFGRLKAIVKKEIEPLYDHRLILRQDSRFKGIELKNERVRYVNYQPTCENMLIEIVEILLTHLPQDINLCEVSLHETKSSSARWKASDNE